MGLKLHSSIVNLLLLHKSKQKKCNTKEEPITFKDKGSNQNKRYFMLGESMYHSYLDRLTADKKQTITSENRKSDPIQTRVQL